MLDHTWLAALDFVYAVVVVRGTGVDILGLVYSSRQVRLGGLLGEIRSRYLNLQTGFVGRACYDVKVLRIHCFYSTCLGADKSRLNILCNTRSSLWLWRCAAYRFYRPRIKNQE